MTTRTIVKKGAAAPSGTANFLPRATEGIVATSTVVGTPA